VYLCVPSEGAIESMTIEIPFSLAVSTASEVETELVSPGSILFNLLVILSLVLL
jgi:hypothetical protein